ncbi:MAG: trypsin-like serine protease, partial [Spirochaetales bacterium]|nr:trypsin-like serine protease [Spirochaetales bacterium]
MGAVLTAAVLLMSGAVSGMRDRITGERNEPVTVNLDVVDNPIESGIRPAQAGGDDVSDEDNNIRIYELYNDAVVNVTTEKLRYTWFFDPVPQEGGTGSGSIIDNKGYVLTNYHVVEDAYKVYVTLSDGSRHEGEVIGKDAENDLAVIKFDPGDIDLVTIPFGTSDGLRVGQKVLAIGNPFAFERALTTGIISGLGRPVRGESNYVIQNMIQTDASINEGNSGGP